MNTDRIRRRAPSVARGDGAMTDPTISFRPDDTAATAQQCAEFPAYWRPDAEWEEEMRRSWDEWEWPEWLEREEEPR